MGGMERASSTLANAFVNEGIDVIFITILKKPHFFSLDHRIQLIEPPDFNIKRISFIKTFLWLRKIIKNTQADLIICYGVFYAALTQLSNFGYNNKLILSERSSPLLKWPLKQELFNSIVFRLKQPSGIVAQTSIAKEYQIEKYGKKPVIEVIPNALNVTQNRKVKERNKSILAVGRLDDPLKGFDRLIKALPKINPEWKVILLGGFNQAEKLKSMAANLGVLDRIDIKGKVKNTDDYYSSSGIFVIPSRSEGFPNALLEAMSFGMACVSFDFIAGPEDLINSEINGIIVKEGDIDKLSDKVNELIDNPAKRELLGKNALYVNKIYSSEAIIQKWLNFIEKVCNVQ